MRIGLMIAPKGQLFGRKKRILRKEKAVEGRSGHRFARIFESPRAVSRVCEALPQELPKGEADCNCSARVQSERGAQNERSPPWLSPPKKVRLRTIEAPTQCDIAGIAGIAASGRYRRYRSRRLF